MQKKLFTSILLLLFVPLVSFGQNNGFKHEWALGINGTVNFSRISFAPNVKQNWLQQFGGGITGRYISESHWGIQAELNISMRGWEEKYDEEVNPNHYSRSLTYLEIPIMTHLYFQTGSKGRIFLNAGPQIGFCLGDKELEREENSTNPDLDFSYYDFDIKNKFDYGIVGGLGFELNSSIGRFVLEGRYYYGLSDLFSNKKTDRFQASGNQVLSIKLTYFFLNT